MIIQDINQLTLPGSSVPSKPYSRYSDELAMHGELKGSKSKAEYEVSRTMTRIKCFPSNLNLFFFLKRKQKNITPSRYPAEAASALFILTQL